MGETPVFLSTGLSPSWRASAIACIIFLLIGIGLGAWGMHTWQVSDLKAQLALTLAKLKHAEDKPPVVKETVKTVTDTQIAYVPKETVVYRDPVSGQTSERPLDGKMTFSKPEFIFTVNGKPGKFTRADDERFVFDKNMMQLTQASTIRIEAEIPTVDKTKHGALGVGYGSHGLAGKLDIKHGWIYADKETKAGGLQFRF